MSDETNVGTPSLGFSAYDNDEIELVSEDELRQSAEGDFATKSREELIAEVQQMKQSLGGGPKPEDLQRELEAVKQNMGSVSLDQLKALAAMQGGQKQQQQPQETEEAFAERLKQSLYDDPVKAMDLYFTRKIAPDVQRLSANNLHWSQKALETDPEMGGIYARYREAIDAEVQKASPQERLYDPKVYSNAAQRVVAANINQIIAEKVQEALGKGTAEAKAPAAGTSPTFSETGMSIPPRGGAAGKVKIALTPEDKRRAFAMGMSEKDYAAAKARKEGKL